jgi:hypothetical protein
VNGCVDHAAAPRTRNGCTGGASKMTAKTTDLSGDNELPELLEERERLRLRIATDQARFAEIRNLLVVKLGEADEAELPGWVITRKVKLRQAHEVSEKEITYISARRVSHRADNPWGAP